VHSVYRGDRYRIVSRLSLAEARTGEPTETPSRTTGHYPGMPASDTSVAYVTRGEVQR